MNVTEAQLARRWYSEHSTIGELLGPSVELLAFTLEDHYPRPYVKTPGKTCIPPGRYQVVRAPSKRFAPRLMLRLLNVPQFTGILIHEGNRPEHTLGCIVVGTSRGIDRVVHSLDALKRVDAAFDRWLERGEVWLTVSLGDGLAC
jgi:hypothetical protein